MNNFADIIAKVEREDHFLSVLNEVEKIDAQAEKEDSNSDEDYIPSGDESFHTEEVVGSSSHEDDIQEIEEEGVEAMANSSSTAKPRSGKEKQFSQDCQGENYRSTGEAKEKRVQKRNAERGEEPLQPPAKRSTERRGGDDDNREGEQERGEGPERS
jgi:hypothetical protein